MAVKMGTGVVDYRTFVEALKEVGFDGHLSYEMCCRLEGGPSEGNLDDLARGALEYSRELIDGK
jgi:sugar phosphate isomerase/epimerase